MSRTRRAGMAAYRALIEAAPDRLVDGADDRLAPWMGRRAQRRDFLKAARFADSVRTPSKWYATDGSNCFYYFRKRHLRFINGDNAFGRIATTIYGIDAAYAYARHNGRITDRRPSGFLSVATLSCAAFGGLDGGPRDWGWTDNEDLDLSIDMVIKLRAQSPGFRVSPQAEDVVRRMERVA